MKTCPISASRSLRRTVFAFGTALTLSLIGNLRADSPPQVYDVGWIMGSGDTISGLIIPGGTGHKTNNDFRLSGSGLMKLDSQSALQFDAGYSRLSPDGAPGSNQYSLDAHFLYKINDIPVGAFLGWDKNGPSTFGGGIEGTLPGKMDWLPKILSPAGDPLVNWQGFYARTHGESLNHVGGMAEMRMYPCEDSRVSLIGGYQHTSSSFAGFKFSDNIWSIGLTYGYLLPIGWLLEAGYEHTHFNTSGLKVNGFSLGVHYCFGKKAKIRDLEMPYQDFSHLLGVQSKF